MKKDKIEVIKMPSSDKECYLCNGTGKLTHKAENVVAICKACDGTGIFKDNHYILIANGMAFSMDTIK